MSEATTYAACLTPPGVAALAVIAMRGPQAWPIARSLFRPRSKSTVLPDEPEPGQFWLGRFGTDVADDVVLAKWSRSTQREQVSAEVEIHCHGGREIVRLLLETLESRGVCVCTWQELERFTGHDPIRSEAIIALCAAKTTRTAAILLDQFNGAFRSAIDAVLQCAEASDAERCLAAIDRYSAIGRHLTQSWRVVVAGAPNVGKSSLVNALAGYQRSIVHPTPGTTRDVVTAQVAFDGWPVELTDTAGVRNESEPMEAEGIDLALDAARSADLCLWVVDGSAPPVWPDAHFEMVQLVINKIDLPSAWDQATAKEAVAVSALTGAGVANLADVIAHRLVPEPLKPGVAVPFTEHLQNTVRSALALCREGRLAEVKDLFAKDFCFFSAK
jgi:tRNA modification GTPase